MGWASGVQFSWRPLPSWLLLLAPPILPITSSHHIFRAFLSPTLLRLLNCGLRVTISLPLLDLPPTARRTGMSTRYLPLRTPCWNTHLMPLQEHAFWLLRRESLELSSMPFLSPPLASEWTTMPLGLQLASGSVPPSAGLTFAITVVQRSTASPLTASVAIGVRVAAVNNVVHRSLSSAKVPSRLEPSGLYCSDGKRPDGITVMPWKDGKLLMWDATCPDTFASSYVALATSEAGAVAAHAEVRKCDKYRRVPSERPPYFHARIARKRGGRINGSDRFCTRGAPPILISAPRP